MAPANWTSESCVTHRTVPNRSDTPGSKSGVLLTSSGAQVKPELGVTKCLVLVVVHILEQTSQLPQVLPFDDVVDGTCAETRFY